MSADNHPGDDEFDYENLEVRERVPRGSTVYSIRFSRAEMTQIRAAAKHVHQTTSEFIRRSAMKEATGQAVRVYFQAFEGRSVLATQTDQGMVPFVRLGGSLAPQGVTHTLLSSAT